MTKLNPNYIWPEPLVHFNSSDVKSCVSLCFGFLYTSKPSTFLTVHLLLSQKYSGLTNLFMTKSTLIQTFTI